ncbi:GNAT family N-acetyltransferase [Marinobacter sp. F4216]|uniref:GNAT family N-acetyltransferase n=1 Tax=Marinobacter sp. F4216 TaxID=2874281 RepID=UPI001CBCCBC1|nr:N-acetyltransferase [Marinobacter sp. F4216]
MKLESYDRFDRQAIEALYARTFSDSEGQSEGARIGALVHQILEQVPPESLLGVVATEHGEIVGCILFTRLSFDTPANAFMLSPVAVSPDYQGTGVGQELINQGIRHMEELGVELVLTYGDPNYYSKVGFQQISQQIVRAPFELSHPEGWLSPSMAAD